MCNISFSGNIPNSDIHSTLIYLETRFFFNSWLMTLSVNFHRNVLMAIFLKPTLAWLCCITFFPSSFFHFQFASCSLNRKFLSAVKYMQNMRERVIFSCYPFCCVTKFMCTGFADKLPYFSFVVWFSLFISDVTIQINFACDAIEQKLALAVTCLCCVCLPACLSFHARHFVCRAADTANGIR